MNEPRSAAGPGDAVRAWSLDALAELARGLMAPGRRSFLGITGAPGAGKSTLAEQLVERLAGDAVLVGMDGFHLRNGELARLGRLDRKGASDTFDAAGYVHLLRRLHGREDRVVYAPLFDRGLEESIGSAVPVPAEVPLVVTEGNYLLADGGWEPVRGLLDQCWYVDPGEDVRRGWLLNRHLRYGRSPEEALDRSHGSDERNAAVIASTRSRASLILTVPDLTRNPEAG